MDIRRMDGSTERRDFDTIEAMKVGLKNARADPTVHEIEMFDGHNVVHEASPEKGFREKPPRTPGAGACVPGHFKKRRARR